MKRLLLAFSLSIAAPSVAAERTFELFQIMDSYRHQDGTTTVSVEDTGKVTFVSRFSNGSRFDGDNFASEIRALDRDGNQIFTAEHRAGLNGSGGGRTRSRTVTQAIQLTPTQLAALDRFEVRHFFIDKRSFKFGIGFNDEDNLSVEIGTDKPNRPARPPFVELPFRQISPPSPASNFAGGGQERLSQFMYETINPRDY